MAKRGKAMLEVDYSLEQYAEDEVAVMLDGCAASFGIVWEVSFDVTDIDPDEPHEKTDAAEERMRE